MTKWKHKTELEKWLTLAPFIGVLLGLIIGIAIYAITFFILQYG